MQAAKKMTIFRNKATNGGEEDTNLWEEAKVEADERL